MSRTLAKGALIGAAASFPASKFKGVSEGMLQRLAEALWPPTEQQKELVGPIPPATSRTCHPP